MSDVKRYDLQCGDGGLDWDVRPFGEWVKASDYDVALQKIAESVRLLNFAKHYFRIAGQDSLADQTITFLQYSATQPTETGDK